MIANGTNWVGQPGPSNRSGPSHPVPEVPPTQSENLNDELLDGGALPSEPDRSVGPVSENPANPAGYNEPGSHSSQAPQTIRDISAHKASDKRSSDGTWQAAGFDPVHGPTSVFRKHTHGGNIWPNQPPAANPRNFQGAFSTQMPYGMPWPYYQHMNVDMSGNNARPFEQGPLQRPHPNIDLLCKCSSCQNENQSIYIAFDQNRTRFNEMTGRLISAAFSRFGTIEEVVLYLNNAGVHVK